MITGYRALDAHGQKMVDLVMEEEARRIKQESKILPLRPTVSVPYYNDRVSIRRHGRVPWPRYL